MMQGESRIMERWLLDVGGSGDETPEWAPGKVIKNLMICKL